MHAHTHTHTLVYNVSLEWTILEALSHCVRTGKGTAFPSWETLDQVTTCTIQAIGHTLSDLPKVRTSNKSLVHSIQHFLANYNSLVVDIKTIIFIFISFLMSSQLLSCMRKWASGHRLFVVCSVAQLCLILCGSMDCSPPGSSVHGISQARILKWVAISHSRGSFGTSGLTCIFCISCNGRWVLYHQHHHLLFLLIEFSAGLSRLVVPLLMGRQACPEAYGAPLWLSQEAGQHCPLLFSSTLHGRHCTCRSGNGNSQMWKDSPKLSWARWAELKYLFRTFLTSHPCLWIFDDPVTLSWAGETSCPLLGQGQTYWPP